jgi:hypothetical protein
MREQDAWDAHAAFMDGLVAEGFVVLGGPLGTGERILLVVDAEDEQAVRDRLATDPWSPMGLLTVAHVDAWTILLEHAASAT